MCPILTTPTPDPSPQGGGEEFVALLQLNLAPMGLVPATPDVIALCLKIRRRRDKPGDDANMKAYWTPISGQ